MDRSNQCEYTVKLGYRKAKTTIIDPTTIASSSCAISNADWKFIWKINTLPRIQQFICRVLNGAIATNYNLFRRHRAASPLFARYVKIRRILLNIYFFNAHGLDVPGLRVACVQKWIIWQSQTLMGNGPILPFK